MIADIPNKRKRRLPRFSLITLVVAVNVTGVLVWANLRDRWHPTPPKNSLSQSERWRGWPMTVSKKRWVATQWTVAGDATFGGTFGWGAFVTNLAAACVIVSVLAGSVEITVRILRKAKRHDG